MTVPATPSSSVQTPRPLVIDVDGTLTPADLLHEAALQFVAQKPWRAYRIPLWLAQGGKSGVKTQLADHVDPGLDTVPLRPEVMQMIARAQADGRPVYLASASDRRYVAKLAERIGGVAGVFGTEPGVNLAGQAKAERLVREFGENGFDYIGDTRADIPVWRQSDQRFLVAHDAGFEARVRREFPDVEMIARDEFRLRPYVKSLRIHQWAKNILLFLPMMAGHRLDIETFAVTLAGFFCFCLAASSAYLINDLLDLPGDRQHARKRHRPFASGALPVTHGLALAAALMIAAFALSLVLPPRFIAVLAIYVATTLLYSLYLKRKPIIDVIALAGLYTIRVFGGLAAAGIQETQWLLMFSLFLFLCLAIVKRCSEIISNRDSGKTKVVGRGYITEDLNILLPMGAAAGYGSVFVVTLYLSSPEVVALYAHPNRLWLICPLLLYWISRALVISNRGEMHDDPVVFALTDRMSWITGALVAAVLITSV